MNEDKVIQEIVELRADVNDIKETMVTKDHLRTELNGIKSTLDTLVTLAKKKDQELTVLGHAVTVLRKDMDMVKPLVGLA